MAICIPLVFIFVLLSFPGLKVLKICSASFLFILLIFLFITKRINFIFDSITFLVGQAIIVIFLSTINSFLRGIQVNVISHAFYVWVITIFVFFVLYILFRNHFINRYQVNKVVLFSVITYLIFKWILLLYMLNLRNDYVYVKERIESLFGFSLIMSHAGFLPRLMTQHDILILVSLVLILWHKIPLRKALFFVISIFLIINGFLTYSRFFWVALVIILVLYYLSTFKKYFLRNALQIMIIVIISTISGFVNPSLVKSIQSRLSSYETEISNQIKLEQIEFFTEEIFDDLCAFLVGHGLGSYLPYYVRNIDQPYSYEVQWLSFVYQYGFLFFIPILIFFLFPAVCFLKNFKDNYSLLLGYLLWILGGFTNPYLISGFAGVLYFVFIVNMKR